MEQLRIHLLGGFLLEKGDRALPPIPSRMGRSLLAYLVLNRGRRQMRDFLSGFFWPELSESRARRRLSHTLWQIQDTLSEVVDPQRYLLITPEALGFQPEAPYWLDVEEFEGTLERVGLLRSGRPLNRAEDLEALRSCVELYRGDFLVGFYEDWVVLEQERLRELYLRAVEQLVQLAKGHGNHEEALTYARRLTHHDPLREEGHQEVMRLCFLLGRVNEALQQFERCRSVLDEELGAAPSPATVALYEKIARHRRSAVGPPTPAEGPLFRPGGEVPFVGREEERRVLVDRLEQALGGRGGILLVEGQPGVGKTRLVREAVEDARWRGFEVLWGASEGPSALRPYHGIAAALAGGLSPLRAEQLGQRVEGVWLGEVARIVPRLGELLGELPPRASLRAEEEPERMREALVRSFLALASVGPLLVVIDDLQWADPDTLQALVRLAERLAGSQILVVVTYRDDEARQQSEVWEVIRALDRLGGRGRILLAPLSVFETGELVRRSLDWKTVPPRFTARLHAETAGNPLFVLETVRALHEEGLGGSAIEGEPATLPIAPSVHELVAGRIDGLAAGVRVVLEVAAVDEEELELAALLGPSPDSREEALAALDELLRRGYLVEDGGRYRFAHELVRRVVYEQMPVPARRRLHRRVGEALEATDPDRPERLAHHFQAAGVADKAVRYLREAGDRSAEIHAYETAARHYGQAVALVDQDGPLDPAERFDLLASYEGVLNVLGGRETQAEVLEGMEDLAGDPGSRAEVLRRRVWLLAHTDRFEEAGRTAREALGIAEAEGDEVLRGGILVALGMAMSWAGRTTEAIPHLEAAVEAHQDDPRQEAEARYALGNALSYVERYEEAQQELEGALELYREVDDVRGEAEALGMLAAVDMERGDTETAGLRYGEALERCRAIGYRQGEAINLGNLGSNRYLRGEVVESLRLFVSASAAFSEIGNRRGQAQVRANVATIFHNFIGDEGRARAEAEAALDYFSEVRDPRGEAQCLDVLGGVARRTGRFGEARKRLTDGLDKAGKSGRRWVEAQLLRSLALLDLDEGAEADALDHIEQAVSICRELGMDDQLVGVLGLQSWGLLQSGEVEEALRTARSSVESLGPGVEQGYLVHWWHHQAAAAAGYWREARAAIEAAHRGLSKALAGLDPDDRESALERVPEHRAIVEAWERVQPVRVPVTVPRADAPLGRSLREEDLIEIVWTAEAPGDEEIEDEIELRRRRILRFLEETAAQGASPTVAGIAEVLGVGPATVKRDLRRLRDEGHDPRTRGTRPTAG